MAEKKNDYQPCVLTPKTEHKRAIVHSDRYIHLAQLSQEDGIQKAEPGEKVDWFAHIQASKKTCDLSSIIARYLSGDATVINVGNPISGDIASLPKNVNDLQDLAVKVRNNYDGLSDEIKGIFGNSFEDFYNAVLSNTVEEKIGAYATAKVEAAKKAAAEAAAAGTQEE